MILAGQLLKVVAPGQCGIVPGTVRIDGDRIVEVTEGEIPRDFDAGGKECFISPGFIDAHLHLPQFDMIGAHGLPLLDWLRQVTFPAETRWSDASFAESMTRRVLDQLISYGTTGFAGYATVHYDSARAAIEVTKESGMRAAIGQVLMNRNAFSELCRPTSQLLDEAERLCEDYPVTERVSAAVTPRFAICCSSDLLQGAGDLAKRTGALVQTHLAETMNECEQVRVLFTGRDYAEVYEDAGLLSSRTILGHGVYLEPSDRELLRHSESVIAHCPTANSFLRSGVMNRQGLIDSGVRLALGSDVGAGYERSMIRVARAMIETAAALGDQYPDASQAWHSITAGNADALGWETSGRIRPGADADLLLIEPTIPWLSGEVDPLTMLMFAWDDRWIKSTFVRGKAHSIQKPSGDIG